MKTADPLAIWSNPYQRFGMIHVNVLIGAGVEEADRELFFGPLPPGEEFVTVVDTSLGQLMASFGIFSSANDAARHGFRGPIPHGFSDYMRIKKLHRVTILKIL